jgi:HSP20 family protein
VITAELAGVDPDELELEIHGRNLILAGRRGPAAVQSDVYQQVEIERGYFRRVIELGADVRAEEAKARYEDGMLRIELPLTQGAPARPVPIESPEREAERS